MTKWMFAISLLIFVGCKDLGEEAPSLPPTIPVKDLLAVPESIVVDAETLTVSTYMWRNFMPTVPSSNTGLIALVYIGKVDSTKMSNSITADAVWIVSGEQAWRSFLAEANQPPSNRLCRIARNGPEWDGPADVIVRVFGSRGDEHMLRASRQAIGKVY